MQKQISFKERVVQRLPKPKKGERWELTDPEYPGLKLRVSLDSRLNLVAKVWLFRFPSRQVDGTNVKDGVTLGVYPGSRNARNHPELSVSQAIDAWQIARGQLKEDLTKEERTRKAWAQLKPLLADGDSVLRMEIFQEMKELFRASGISLEGLLEKYRVHRKANGLEAVAEAESRVLKNHLPVNWLERPAEEIEVSEVAELIDTLRTRAPSISAVFYSTIKRIYRFGWKRQFLSSFTMDLLDPPRVKSKPRERRLSDEEVVVLGADLEIKRAYGNNRTPDPAMADAFWFLLATGCRRIEALPMIWSEVKKEDGQVLFKIPEERSKNRHAHTVALGVWHER